MVDTNILLLKLLTANTLGTNVVTAALNGGKIYAGILPEGVDPTAKPAIEISTQSGDCHPEIVEWAKARIQVRCWAGVNQQAVARSLYRAVHDWIHGRQNLNFGSDGYIVTCLETVLGQDVTDPDTGWATVVAFYELTAR